MSTEQSGTDTAATLPEEQVLAQFRTSLSGGLSSRTAEERLASAGPNAISAGGVPWRESATRQFRSAFICLHLIAASSGPSARSSSAQNR